MSPIFIGQVVKITKQFVESDCCQNERNERVKMPLLEWFNTLTVISAPPCLRAHRSTYGGGGGVRVYRRTL